MQAGDVRSSRIADLGATAVRRPSLDVIAVQQLPLSTAAVNDREHMR